MNKKRLLLSELFIVRRGKTASKLALAINFTILAFVLGFVIWYSLDRVNVNFDFSFVVKFRKRILDGFYLTVYISALSMIFSLVIGTLCALAQNSRILILRLFSKVYVGFIRGTPLIMQIYLFYYIVGTAIGLNDRIIAGVLILSIFEGAYAAEIIRGSYLSLEQSQLDAALAVGFTPVQRFRYVIFPQLAARTIPALTGQLASIIKDSSLLSMISVIELMQTMREISSLTLRLFETYFFLGVAYLLLTLPVSFFARWLERRFAFEN